MICVLQQHMDGWFTGKWVRVSFTAVLQSPRTDWQGGLSDTAQHGTHICCTNGSHCSDERKKTVEKLGERLSQGFPVITHKELY